MCAQIAKETRLNKSTVVAYVRTMKALESRKAPSTAPYRLLAPLRIACEERPDLLEKIKKALELYRPQDPVQNAEKIAEKILELSKEHKRKGGFKQAVGAALGLSGETVAKHIQTMRAVTEGGRPASGHVESLYQMLIEECRADNEFREKIGSAIESYEEIDDLERIERVIEGILKYAPLCRKGKVELKKYVAGKTCSSEGNVKLYVQAMRALRKEYDPPPAFKRRRQQSIENRYKKEAKFRNRVNEAVDAYGQLDQKKEIGYGGLVAEAGLSLELYAAKRPTEEKTKWAAENMLKRVEYGAVHKLAMEKKIGTNELLRMAIMQAEKDD